MNLFHPEPNSPHNEEREVDKKMIIVINQLTEDHLYKTWTAI